MFPVNCPVVQFFVDTMYLSACSTPPNSWKTQIFSSYNRFCSYEATRVVLLGISRIKGFTGRTYGTGDSVAYFELVIKSPRSPVVAPPMLD